MRFAPQGQIPCCASVPIGPAVLVFTLQAAFADINIAKNRSVVWLDAVMEKDMEKKLIAFAPGTTCAEDRREQAREDAMSGPGRDLRFSTLWREEDTQGANLFKGQTQRSELLPR